MKQLQSEAIELHTQGYDIAEIAEELGITKTKVQALIDDAPSQTQKPQAEKRTTRQRLQATEKLKESFDELVEKVQELDEETLDADTSHELLEQCRQLEFRFRKTAQQFELDYSESEHWDAVQTLATTLKKAIKIAEDDDDDLELDLEADLLERLDDLRFELVAFE